MLRFPNAVATILMLCLAVPATVIAAEGAGATPAAGAAAAEPDFSQPGPHAVEVLREAGCCDSGGHPFDLYLPAADDGAARLPLLAFGVGTWASPKKYDHLLRHIASWGFVVIVSHDNSAADGQSLLDAVDHALRADADPASPLAGRIDAQRIGVAGHSQGAGGAMNALMAMDGQLRTAVAVNLPGQQLCRPGDCERIPLDMPDGTSVLLLTGTRDGIAPPLQDAPTDPPYQSVRAYYDAVPAGRVKAMGALVDADHNDIQGQPGCGWFSPGCRHGVSGYLGPLTAWLAWQLRGDAAAGSAYFAAGCGRLFRDEAWTAAASDTGLACAGR
ncbi:hypothetical protein LDO26_06145 [Luteimonas sp. BDR2-5]|uniref:poly(ethylene terephthalate) hydrolase family protein n=1 Tax=Proluteimonas luteida TaxID=2878685 RepID=UPI001E28BCBC|nr:hypothetical protein [Luteimonas sp. BDR2-5]MCD9027783.1 hypothetical protein [Luteimonas sp. BDR2-5]